MLRKLKALALAAGLALPLAVPVHAQTVDRLVLAAGADALTLASPDAFTFVPDRMLADHIQDPLFRVSEPGKLIPWLATEWKEVSDTVLELTLRQGVTFSNGEPFNAATVKYYVDTIKDPKNAAVVRTSSLWIDSVEIVNDHTVRLVSKAPFPQRLTMLSNFLMLPPKYISEVGWDGYKRKPIGTGPFILAEHVRDDHILLKANPNWWGGAPQIKEIYYRPIKEEAARAAAVMAGEVDIAFDLAPELAPMIEASGRAKIKRTLSTRTYLLNMSNTNPAAPGNNPKFREAVTYALDLEALNQGILGGTGAPAAFWSPWTFGINPDLKPIKQDVERAKKALADAGYPNGIDLMLDTSYGRYMKDKELAEAIAGQLTAVGIRTRVQTYEWGVLTQRRTSGQISPLYLMAWSDAQADPELPNMRVLITGNPFSVISYPELDTLMKKISVEPDREKRKQLILEQQDYMRKNNNIVFLLHMGVINAVSDRMSWWEPVATERYFFYQNPKM